MWDELGGHNTQLVTSREDEVPVILMKEIDTD